MRTRTNTKPQETQGACEVQRIVASGDRSFNPTRIKTLTINDRDAFYQQVPLFGKAMTKETVVVSIVVGQTIVVRNSRCI